MLLKTNGLMASCVASGFAKPSNSLKKKHMKFFFANTNYPLENK